jgi:hypothetical protein
VNVVEFPLTLTLSPSNGAREIRGWQWLDDYEILGAFRLPRKNSTIDVG